MTWKPIIAGVDPTIEGTRAAVTAVVVAQQAGTKCHLVHAVRDPWVDVTHAEFPMSVGALNAQLLDAADARLRTTLESVLPADVLRDLTIRMGTPAGVIQDAVDQHEAELVVLGGKHHTTLGRWLAGSTAHTVVRRTDVPLLVTGNWNGGIRRIVAAVDLSSAARPTIAAAERMAELFGAALTVVHVIEPVPIVDGVVLTITPEELRDRAEEELHRSVWPSITRRVTWRMVREGVANDVIPQVVQEQQADLLVVGSHGRGWVDRLLIGSATERLLNQLPCSMLIVPIFTPAREAARAQHGQERQAGMALAGGIPQ